MPTENVHIAAIGPVAVTGGAYPFHRSASLELVVYLAFHRDGVRHGDWAAALWPDRPVTAATVHSTASDARRALGRAADGTDHLPRGTSLRLGDGVRTDVERFRALARSGDPHQLDRAMALVRGPVLSGLRLADWAVFDGTLAAVESMVVDAALRGADILVGLGRGADAERMVRRAMVACPYDERLYRALLCASAAQDNRVGLHTTMEQLLCLAGRVGRGAYRGPDRFEGQDRLDYLHPATTALYRDLLRGLPAPGGHPARL